MPQCHNFPRLILGGTNSGCGKTTVTCALLQLLMLEGKKVASFKCGPDYIDPMFHGEIIGTSSSNLDPFFYSPETMQERFASHAVDRDISVIEGVMGFYDGIKLNTEQGSTYDVARLTQSPVVLTVNCKGMANSAVALIKGFCEYRADNHIKGVILNHITEHTYRAVKVAIEREIPTIKVLGYLPKLPQELMLESRHLGLVTASEIPALKEKLLSLAEIARKTLDLEGIVELATSAIPICQSETTTTSVGKVRIGVAQDRAFCFYYKDNLQLLEELGAELVPFSPMLADALPDCLDALYIGGGYPELYKEQLSKNEKLRREILVALESGMPCIAECGGFMYLGHEIEGLPMVGFLKGSSHNTGKLGRFGYLTLTAKEDSLILPKDGQVKAHEFHYFDCSENGDGFVAQKTSGVSWDCVVASESFYGGFPHLAFYSNISTAERFVKKALEYQQNRDMLRQ